MKPELSIIIPVYNGEEYIDSCLNSIFHQNGFDNFELIIVNDGSCDGSLGRIKKHAIRHDNLIYFTQQNQGVSRARNWGIEHANGEYITFIDIDDKVGVSYDSIRNSFIGPNVTSKNIMGLQFSQRNISKKEEICHSFEQNYFTKMLSAIADTKPDIALAGKYTVNHDEMYTKQHVYLSDQIYDNSADAKESLLIHADRRESANFALYHRDFLDQHNLLFQDGMQLDEDMLFCMQTVLFANQAMTISGATYLYNRHGDSLSNISRKFESNQKYTKANLQRYSALLLLIMENPKYARIFNLLLRKFAKLGEHSVTDHHSFPSMCYMCPNTICEECYHKEKVIKKIKNNIWKFLPNYFHKYRRVK